MIGRRIVEPAWPLLVVLLIASLALKAHGWRARGGIDQASAEAERADIAGWLARSGFAVQAAGRAVASISGTRGACRIVVTAVDPRGFHRRIVGARRPAGTALFYSFEGVRYAEQPLLRTWARHQLWARARDMGVRLPRHVPLAALASGCDAADLRWDEVGRIA